MLTSKVRYIKLCICVIIGGFALLRHVNLCDGQILARSAIEKLQLQYVISDERYRRAIF